jgi:hypothetical protein
MNSPADSRLVGLGNIGNKSPAPARVRDESRDQFTADIGRLCSVAGLSATLLREADVVSPSAVAAGYPRF